MLRQLALPVVLPGWSSRSTSAKPLSVRIAPMTVPRVVLRAKQQKDDNGDAPSTSTQVNSLLEDLKKAGLDKERARAVLKKWEELGIKDSTQLRRLLIRRSLRPALVLGFQALLDCLPCYGGFYAANLISESEPFPFQIGLQLLATFFGFYYVIQVMLNLSVITTLAYTAYKYGTNSDEVLMAVQQLAGPTTGLNVVDRAQVAVNTLKVLSTLDEVADLLKEIPSYNTERGTLQNLSAYLTLSRARESGFTPAKYGLSEKEAGEVAYVFSLYDLNDDSRLELSEIKKLCAGLGKTLSDDETQEAMRILDTRKSGFVEFDEFVEWWTKKASGKEAAVTLPP